VPKVPKFGHLLHLKGAALDEKKEVYSLGSPEMTCLSLNGSGSPVPLDKKGHLVRDDSKLKKQKSAMNSFE
jgi:hypothetical protein